MEDQEHLQPILDSYGTFKPLKTIPIFNLHLLLACILEIMSIAYAMEHPDKRSRCREYFTILYIHICLWFVTLVSIMIIDHFERGYHTLL